jgi:hypothetical protein
MVRLLLGKGGRNLARAGLAAFGVAACASVANAQSPKIAAYVYTDPSGSSRLVDTVTGTQNPFIYATGLSKPLDCPPNGFWGDPGTVVFDCLGRLKFEAAKNAQEPQGNFPANARFLMQAPGTDDPGPMGKKRVNPG